MPREAADQTPEPQQFPSAAAASMGSTLSSGLARCLLATLAMASCGSVLAQTDEIQVYDAGIAPVGVFALTWHNNFTTSGARAPENPGGVVPNHSLNGVTEWAYGVTHWFEAGLYLPLYTATPDGAVLVDGFKLRMLLVSPDAAHTTTLARCGTSTRAHSSPTSSLRYSTTVAHPRSRSRRAWASGWPAQPITVYSSSFSRAT